jgi:hypothetical protein
MGTSISHFEPWLHAQGTPIPFEELARDPVVFVACALLIGVSVAWLLVARMMARGERQIRRAMRPIKKPRHHHNDIWRTPP